MPKLTASGDRNSAYKGFKSAHASASDQDYIAMLVDSEDPVKDVYSPWAHLVEREGWNVPPGATDEQVLLMATCMETWIVADGRALSAHYGQCLQMSALPAVYNLESKDTKTVQDSLFHATRNCTGPYDKGKKSYELLGQINPPPSTPCCPASRGHGTYWTQNCEPATFTATSGRIPRHGQVVPSGHANDIRSAGLFDIGRARPARRNRSLVVANPVPDGSPGVTSRHIPTFVRLSDGTEGRRQVVRRRLRQPARWTDHRREPGDGDLGGHLSEIAKTAATFGDFSPPRTVARVKHLHDNFPFQIGNGRIPSWFFPKLFP